MRGVVTSLALLAIASVVAASAMASGPATRAVVHGAVMLSPTRPVCIEGHPCSEPAAGVVLAFARDGRIVARPRTTRTGTYRVRLRPGRYTVTVPAYRRPGGITPRIVVVPRSRSIRLDFEIATGIQ